MKILFRTIAILAAALVIVGALLAFSSGSSATNPSGNPPDRSAIAQNQATGSAGATTTNGGLQPPERGHSDAPSLGGIVEVLKNLAIVGVIIAIVSQGKRLLGCKRQGGKPVPRQTAAPTPTPSL